MNPPRFRLSRPMRPVRFACVAPALLAILLLAGCHATTASFDDRLVVGEVIMHSEFATHLRAITTPGGRLSGSDGGRAAEEYMAAQARALGLRNVAFEPFTMPGWKLRETVVAVLDEPPVVLTGALGLGNSLSTPVEGITAELVDVGQGSPDEFAAVGEKLRGRFALTAHGGQHRSAKMEAVIAAGGVGLIVMAAPAADPVIGMVHWSPRSLPGLVISHDDGERLAERLAAGEVVRVNVRLTADSWQAEPRNVVAEIPGRGRLAREVVIVGAHLDSWDMAEGAIDNGAGAAVILEVARALTRVGWQPRRTVRFVWFMGEEHGLYGSRAYVAAHADELDHIVTMVNVDMPGEPRGWAHFGHAEIEPLLAGVTESLSAYELSPEIQVWPGAPSDQQPFVDQGVCGLWMLGDMGPDVVVYHTARDTYERGDRRRANAAAVARAVLTRRLADAPQRPAERRAVAAETGE